MSFRARFRKLTFPHIFNGMEKIENMGEFVGWVECNVTHHSKLVHIDGLRFTPPILQIRPFLLSISLY